MVGYPGVFPANVADNIHKIMLHGGVCWYFGVVDEYDCGGWFGVDE